MPFQHAAKAISVHAQSAAMRDAIFPMAFVLRRQRAASCHAFVQCAITVPEPLSTS